MGLYDTFYIKTKCPRCGKEEEFDFQTKALGENMLSWRQGEPFIHPDLDIVEGKICNCYAIHFGCPNPNHKEDGFTFFYADVVIKDGIVVGVENVREEE